MNWIFSTPCTAEETKSGFIIHLLGGAWVEPDEVNAQPPRDMSAADQAKHLRLGLKFAKEFMSK